MNKEYVMGNGAIGLGALASGINLASGYPGTPSSEIIETINKYREKYGYEAHVEWSVNEKAALEVAAGASYAGARTVVTMKQVGLNVASDPLMSLAYIGVEGGMVVVVADDPGPISSQTEQDTRMFAEFCRIPVFDPSSPEEAFEMVKDAFLYSEKYKTPVILRPTTRVCHGYASIEADENAKPKVCGGFVKDSGRWVIFPRLSRKNHEMIEKRNVEIGKDFSSYKFNRISGNGKKAVITSGVSYAYVKEYLKDRDDVVLIKIGTPYPFPKDLVLKGLEGVSDVICIEELSPYLENQVLRLAGKYKLNINVFGKETGHSPLAGENDAEGAAKILGEFLGEAAFADENRFKDAPNPPKRPPVLCAGCSHRAAFYAVKKAMKGRKAFFSGDIGCYTLGNAKPLDMVDTCLCMGGGFTVPQGLFHMEKDAVCFGFVGDSTFFASGITGVINAVTNEADVVLCVLDNSTTAMTGHQPHPGTGKNMMGNPVDKISIEAVLKGVGVKSVETVDPLDLNAAIETVKRMADLKGVRAIIFKSPCAVLFKSDKKVKICDNCVSCMRCITEIGCPAIYAEGDAVKIDKDLCNGCGLCIPVCPVCAIRGEDDE